MKVSEEDCTIVIPAYNEAGRIGGLLDGLAEYHGQIIVVCDGDDNTAGVVRSFAESHPSCRMECREYNERLGKGGGVTAGLMHAKTLYAGFMDADGSTTIHEMKRLFSHLSDADGIIGSRWIEGACVPVRQSKGRQVQSRLFNLFVRLVFSLPFYDTQCGAKVFRTKAVQAVLSSVQSQGFEFDVELLWQMKRQGFVIQEVPIRWEDQPDSRVGSTTGFAMLKGLLKIRFGRLP
ncbi:glycosyltransferase family 2 protein [Methanogenium marinum]|uniref:dolichyl-phosphate beta-glucosyltransferase n=1 Tax=Methanogenium marinum TaxID=348610 RepID=A0A9Q4PVW8_9EURY|nr:dolichyl-phosphate beta-glucosyltransferase [Methanogenium marinum]MDE4908019.1 glycosyltransferase family 2 protein [Methanogenium marinum]